MKTNRTTSWFAAVVLCLFWVAVTDHESSAGEKPSAKDKIKTLQKQRLEAAIKARDYRFIMFQKGFLPEGMDAVASSQQLVDLNTLVFRARLDLCEKKAERISAIEDSIKVTEPIVLIFEKRFKAGARNAE